MDYLLFRLDALPEGELTLLDEAEQAQYAARGESFLRVRSQLKRELALRTGKAAGDLRFTYSPAGKPLCAEQDFNLSHSGELLCMAFHGGPVGVDIQQHRALSHLRSVAERILSEEQLAALELFGFPPQEFFDCWCTAEALVKWAGDSIFHARRYPFIYDGGRIRPLFDGAPRVQLFRPAEGYSGAVAYGGCPGENAPAESPAQHAMNA